MNLEKPLPRSANRSLVQALALRPWRRDDRIGLDPKAKEQWIMVNQWWINGESMVNSDE